MNRYVALNQVTDLVIKTNRQWFTDWYLVHDFQDHLTQDNLTLDPPTSIS